MIHHPRRQGSSLYNHQQPETQAAKIMFHNPLNILHRKWKDFSEHVLCGYFFLASLKLETGQTRLSSSNWSHEIHRYMNTEYRPKTITQHIQHYLLPCSGCVLWSDTIKQQKVRWHSSRWNIPPGTWAPYPKAFLKWTQCHVDSAYLLKVSVSGERGVEAHWVRSSWQELT